MDKAEKILSLFPKAMRATHIGNEVYILENEDGTKNIFDGVSDKTSIELNFLQHAFINEKYLLLFKPIKGYSIIEMSSMRSFHFDLAEGYRKLTEELVLFINPNKTVSFVLLPNLEFSTSRRIKCYEKVHDEFYLLFFPEGEIASLKPKDGEFPLSVIHESEYDAIREAHPKITRHSV